MQILSNKLCIRFLYGEMLRENRENYSFEPGINIDIWIAKIVNELSASSIAGIFIL